MILKLYKGIKFLFFRISCLINYYACTLLFKLHNIQFKAIKTIGLPIIDVARTSVFEIGNDFVMVNNAAHAILGKDNRCKFVVYENAILSIGSKVGMSNTTIVATKSVTIGNNVMIGGGVIIVDSDFHSLNPNHWHTGADYENMKSAGVVIGDNVFIGMNSIILKGCIIGSNVIIAAGAVITKDIPDNQIWGGNPAKFIGSSNC